MVESGDVDGLAEYLEKFPGLVDARAHPDGAGYCPTLLHETARQSDQELGEMLAAIAACLLRDGAAINAGVLGATGETPLHYACRAQNAAVAEVLLRAGASLEVPGAYNDGIDTPLGYALFYGRPFTRAALPHCVHLLLHYGAQVHLPFAAALGRLERVRQFFHSHGGLLPTAGIGAPERLLAQALFFAACYGYIEVADHLLQQGAGINTCMPFFEHHCTPLHLACEYGQQTDFVAFLIDRGADPTAADRRYDATPLGWAMFCGQDEVFRLLRSRG